MVTCEVIITICDIAMATLMFLFQRGQTHRATVMGFGSLIMLYIANIVLIWA